MLGSVPCTHHKFVKTTPNPRATKKSKGELVGPVAPLPPLGLVVADGAVDVDMDNLN